MVDVFKMLRLYDAIITNKRAKRNMGLTSAGSIAPSIANGVCSIEAGDY